MSIFVRYKRHVEAGDVLFVYLGFKNIYPLHITPGEVFQTKYGALRHDDLIGQEYGQVIDCAKGWVHILHASPELWTLTLPHRTQILYTTDISLITFQLDLRPGSVVVEAGTGSASLSHAIARTIAPDGHLFTFDFHQERVDSARKEFADHLLDAIVTVGHRDVCADGFGLEQVADAVFLDLPHPWEAIESAKKVLKGKGSRLCAFSPCIEQVQKTCAKLRQCRFVDIETIECLLKPLDVKKSKLAIYDFEKSLTKKGKVDEDDLAEKSGKKQKVAAGHSNGDGCQSFCKDYTCAVPPKQVAGHTGYLTFAALH